MKMVICFAVFPICMTTVSDSKGGAGYFSLMGYGNNLAPGKIPSQVDAYLKLAAGWATAIDITSSSNLTGTLVAAPNSGYNTFYRYRKPGVTTEYFLLENRQKTGRDIEFAFCWSCHLACRPTWRQG